MQAKAQLIGVSQTRFNDGTVRDSIDVRLETGEVVKFWPTNEAGDSVARLADAPMGTGLVLDLGIGSRDGKPTLRLVGVKAA